MEGERKRYLYSLGEEQYYFSPGTEVDCRIIIGTSKTAQHFVDIFVNFPYGCIKPAVSKY